jgi:2-aminobenzoate-CoA ligase
MMPHLCVSISRQKISGPNGLFLFPELQYPDRLNCVEVLLEKAQDKQFAERLALAGSGVRWTYAELSSVSARIALTLQRTYGLKPDNAC